MTVHTATVRVKFCLCRAVTQWGEEVRVVGDHKDLGGWRPLQAKPLATDTTVYPSWCSDAVQLSIEQEARSIDYICISYKYIRDQRDLGHGIAWEDRITNRTVNIPVKGELGATWLVSDLEFDTDGVPKIMKEATQTATSMQTLTDLHSKAAFRKSLTKPLTVKSGFSSIYSLEGDLPLAKGGFSSVWRCRSQCSDSRSQFAVKCIDVKRMTNLDKKLLFGNESCVGEIAVHARLRHPNIVDLLEVFNDHGAVFLVMECCHGGDLFEIVSSHYSTHKQGLPETTAAQIMRQVLVAVAFLHKHGIVHRDVKCENILRAETRDSLPLEQSTFKLGDFGFSTVVMPDESLLDPVGSPYTCAPEVAKGLPYAQPADIWSSGATLFTMLRARRLSHASIFSWYCTEASRCHIDLQDGQWGCTSKEVRNFVMALLQPNPDLRPSAEEALMNTWLQRQWLNSIFCGLLSLFDK